MKIMESLLNYKFSKRLRNISIVKWKKNWSYLKSYKDYGRVFVCQSGLCPVETILMTSIKTKWMRKKTNKPRRTLQRELHGRTKFRTYDELSYHSVQIKRAIVNQRFIWLRRIVKDNFYNNMISIHLYFVALPSEVITAAILLAIKE